MAFFFSPSLIQQPQKKEYDEMITERMRGGERLCQITVNQKKKERSTDTIQPSVRSERRKAAPPAIKVDQSSTSSKK